jgi:peptidoglycan/xylan/chitin deacetylase (PgdA/CDA1 family)
MLFVSPLLKYAAYPALSNLAYFRSWRTRQVNPLTVLTYHGVFPQGYVPRSRLLDGNLVSAKRLHRQLSLLKRHYNVVCPEEFLRFLEEGIQLPPRAVLLTCDDGLANVVSDMLPVLQDLELKCLFFITGASLTENPGMLWHEELWLLFASASPRTLNFQHPAAFVSEIPGDQQKQHNAWWKLVCQLSRTDVSTRKRFLQELSFAANLSEGWKTELLQNPVQRKRFQLLTKSEVDKLVSAGMTIGAHSMTHPVLSECSRETAEEEIARPLVLAQNELKASLWSLAYPYGTLETVSTREVALAETAGYRCAFMNIGGIVLPAVDRFAIPRTHITAALNLGEFEAHASGFHQRLQSRLSRSASPRHGGAVLSHS